MGTTKYFIMLCLLGVSQTGQASNEFAMIVHGASIHSNCTEGTGPKAKTCDLEAFNPGIGGEWSFLGSQETGKLSLRSGIYRDSFSDTAFYAGATYRKEWEVINDWRLGLGLLAGYLKGSGADGFTVLPIAIMSYQRLALEVGYAPKTDAVPGRKHSEVVAFVLRWQF